MSKSKERTKGSREPSPKPSAKPSAREARPASRTSPAAAPPVNLEEVRGRIDSIDEQIQKLINDRARLAQLVGISKTREGRTVDFYRPEREAQVLRMARERNTGPLRDDEVLRLFREIMSACLAQQEPLKVAFLGPEGTFTQSAVFTHFGHSVRGLPLSSIDEVFHEVEAANADFGVVPIENSTEGTVNHTLDRFLTSPLKICGEVELRIHHFLMGSMGSLGRIVRICSHPQSLAQCRVWLEEHLPSVELVPTTSLTATNVLPSSCASSVGCSIVRYSPAKTRVRSSSRRSGAIEARNPTRP